MNFHQLPAVSSEIISPSKLQCPRSSESTAAGSHQSTVLGVLQEVFDGLQARLKRVVVSTQTSPPLPTQKIMRKLVEWLMGLCWNYSIDESGLFLAVTLLANFIRNREVQRKQLQAVAVTSLLIASKYTQVSKLRLKDVVEFCSGIYSVEQIAELEGQILQLHEFDLEVETTNHYLNECLWQGSLTSTERYELCFLLEIQLLMQEEGRKPREIFCQVLQFVRSRTTANEAPTSTKPTSQFMKRLIKFARETPHATVLKKYMSRFDTEAYLKELTSE